MEVIQDVGRCSYEVKVDEYTQEIMERLADLYGMEVPEIMKAMLKFAESMAVSRILNPIAKGVVL